VSPISGSAAVAVTGTEAGAGATAERHLAGRRQQSGRGECAAAGGQVDAVDGRCGCPDPHRAGFDLLRKRLLLSH
jgi:hypothetical protein